jgi:cation transport ATPase
MPMFRDPICGRSESTLLRLVAKLARGNGHPIAAAIIAGEGVVGVNERLLNRIEL